MRVLGWGTQARVDVTGGRRLRGKDGELLPERAVCEAFVNEHGGSWILLSVR